MSRALALAALLAAASGCTDCGSKKASSLAWPQADGLFHQDPRWLGADAAFSIPLGDGRVLWLFGDTFVSTSAENTRAKSKMVRNTIGVQRGLDPTTARMKFYWRGDPAAPSSFFPEDGDTWLWPGHGMVLGRSLVVFLQRVKATPEGGAFGFTSTGWSAAIIDDVSADPLLWAPRIVTPESAPRGIAVGSAVNLIDGSVVALAQREPGDHAGFLVQWSPDDLLAGRLDAAQWFRADQGWVPQAQLGSEGPSVVMANAGPESSLHFDAEKSRWVHVRSEGFGSTTIVRSFALSPEGPWSAPEVVFRPPESDRKGVLVYAAKAHPELEAGGALAVTWATNATDLGKVVNDATLYYPRFARLPR